ncbi:MAG: transporter substrate-binding domain-containing protein [Deltaproteobacteria bacterium]|nr:transporter substrate-binding domain-containing protein [Deltaproteobacteria bacterium]
MNQHRFVLNISSLTILFTIALMLFAGGPAPDNCNASETKKIRVGSELDFPPYAFLDESGKPTGFSIDLIEAVTNAMGLPITITTGSWDTVWNDLIDARIDILPIVAKAAERERLLDFSLPHTETYDAFFVHQGNPAIKDIAAARGKEIVVMRSDAAHHELLKREFKGKLILVDTIPEGMSMISSEKHDAFLCSKLIGTLVIKKHGLKDIIPGAPIPDYKRIFCFAVKKGQKELLEKLNQGLLIVKTNGQYDRIYDKWLSAHDPLRKLREYFWPAIMILAGMVVIFGIWMATLQKRIKERNRELAERKRAEKALRESEERLKEIQKDLSLAQQIAHIGSWNYDVKTGELQWSDELFRIYGLDPKETSLILEHSIGMIHPDDVEFAGEAFNKAVNEGLSYEIEYRIIRPDGEERFVQGIGKILKDHESNAVRVFGTGQDITQRKIAEKALKQSEEMFSKFFFSSPTWLAFTRLEDGKYLEVNKAFEKVTGFHRDEVIGRTSLELGLWPETKERERLMQMAREEGGFQEQAVTFLTKEGDPLQALWSAEVIELDGEDCLLSTVMDISELKRSQEEQVHLRHQLERSQRMEAIGTLAGGVAHEFNNVLSVILGNTELAMDDVPEDLPATDCLKEIRTATLRAKDVVLELLTFSRKMEKKRKRMDLSILVKESLHMLRATIPTSIEFALNVREDTHYVHADPTQMNQVLLNLALNAADAMRDAIGLLTVTLQNTTFDKDQILFDATLPPGDYVKLSVSDNGTGIDPALFDRIFEPYFTTKELGKGTGMGLSVVHGIVKRHGGGIHIDSGTGRGTTFEIFFPAIDMASESEDNSENTIPRGTETILFLDDEASLVNLNRQRLERLGYTVIPETDPSKALAIFCNDPDKIDLVITDMTMPGMTGDQLAQAILETRPGMPIILCTGYSEKISDARAQDLGIGKYIEKPIGTDILASSIREVLDGEP